MRILVLTNLYPNPFQPHKAPFNRHQLRLLAKRHEVRVIAPILWTDERRIRRSGHPRLPKDRRVELDGLIVDHPRYWYTPRSLRSWYGKFFQWSVRRAFRVALDEIRPEIVFAPWAYPDGWAAVRLGHEAGIPVVLQAHGSDVRMIDHYRGRYRGTAEAVSRADGVIAVSVDLAERVLRLGADPERTRVIIDGVDLEIFRPGDRIEAQSKLGLKPGVRHLLFIGNLAPVKGLDILIDACSRLPSEFGSWELHLIGEGNMRGRLVDQATRAGLTDRIRFHGSRPHAELPEWYRASDVFILPSRSEGTPNVLLEAAACGTPFVATEVGGVPAIAHLGAGRLVPPEDPTRLAEAIADIFTEPPPKATGHPRDRREAVSELATFLEATVERYRSYEQSRIAAANSIKY